PGRSRPVCCTPLLEWRSPIIGPAAYTPLMHPVLSGRGFLPQPCTLNFGFPLYAQMNAGRPDLKCTCVPRPLTDDGQESVSWTVSRLAVREHGDALSLECNQSFVGGNQGQSEDFRRCCNEMVGWITVGK